LARKGDSRQRHSNFSISTEKDRFYTALATSDERKDTEAVLNHLGLKSLFDIILCAGKVDLPKPHPETIFNICKKLSVDPQEAVMVGDSVTDMIMGKRAGVVLTIGIVEGGVTPSEELVKVADLVVNSMRELTFYEP
jgi:phosphoglycolate phosphatase